MLGKVLWHVTMSADGFIAGRDDQMDWMSGHGKPGPIAHEVIEQTGAILAGRRGYDAGMRAGHGTGPIYGGAWSGPVFVLTTRPDDVPSDPTVTFVSDPIDVALATVRAAAGDRSVGLFGASIGRQCVQLGLLNDLIVHVVPVLLGDGIRLYDAPGLEAIAMEQVMSAGAGQITDLRFTLR